MSLSIRTAIHKTTVQGIPGRLSIAETVAYLKAAGVSEAAMAPGSRNVEQLSEAFINRVEAEEVQ